MTGWFNIVGLLGIVASVATAPPSSSTPCSASTGSTSSASTSATPSTSSARRFLLFLIILFLYTLVNIFADRFLALMNNISVGWHLLGVAVIIGLLVFVPDHHQSASFVFGERINNNGAFGGSTSGLGFWLLVVPVGFLLTMYTQTGYDASAHTAEETRGAAKAAAQGVWRSVFWSAVIGWFVLLAFLFAATDVAAVDDGAGFSADLHQRARLVGGEAGDPDRHSRAALLRGGGPDQRLAHLVRVLARPGDSGLVDLPPGEPRPGAVQRGDRVSRCSRC